MNTIFCLVILLSVTAFCSAILCNRCITRNPRSVLLEKLDGFEKITSAEECSGNDLVECDDDVTKCLTLTKVGLTGTLTVYGCVEDILTTTNYTHFLREGLCHGLDGLKAFGMTNYCSTCSGDGCNKVGATKSKPSHDQDEAEWLAPEGTEDNGDRIKCYRCLEKLGGRSNRKFRHRSVVVDKMGKVSYMNACHTRVNGKLRDSDLTTCAKGVPECIQLTGDFDDGLSMTTRGCLGDRWLNGGKTPVPLIAETCDYIDGTGDREVSFSCSTCDLDGCNSAVKAKASLLLAVLVGVIAKLVF